MAESSIFDMVVDEILERQNLAISELKVRFKKTTPFRMKEVTREDRLVEYAQFDEEYARQNFDGAQVDQYVRTMEELKGRGKNG